MNGTFPSTPTTSNKRMVLGATPGKLAAVGALSLVLLYVLFHGEGDVEPAVRLAEQRTNSTSSVTSPSDAPVAAQTTRRFPRWNDGRSLFDPFSRELPGDAERRAAARAALAKDNPQQQTTTLEQLREAEQAMVFVSGSQKFAQFGEKQLRVGDEVGDYRVRDIDSNGVWLIER